MSRSNRYAIIMAGGAGTRLWPMSRRNRPKQLLPLVKGKSLLRLAYQRIADMLPAENIFIITGKAYVPAASEVLGELPRANFIGEPEGRDTANAVGLGAVAVSEANPDGVIATLTAEAGRGIQRRYAQGAQKLGV